MVAVQQVIRGQLLITFIPAPHKRSAAGILGPPPRRVTEDWDAIRAAAQQAIAEDAVSDG